MNALLSLYEKSGSEEFARKLVERGSNIISSGGTAKYLAEHGIPVTDISKITGYPPVLRHRVVTLAPQIHGGLLATPDLYPELDELGWKKIDLLYVTFYPLEKELNREGATFESCLEKTDIGGPTMIRSANKGGHVIVLTHGGYEQLVLDWLDKDKPDRENFLFRLRAHAEYAVRKYIELSSEVYERFGKSYGYNGSGGFPKYLMHVDDRYEFLPLARAASIYDCGHIPVNLGGFVLERDGSVREMTLEDRSAISDAADEHSANK